MGELQAKAKTNLSEVIMWSALQFFMKIKIIMTSTPQKLQHHSSYSDYILVKEIFEMRPEQTIRPAIITAIWFPSHLNSKHSLLHTFDTIQDL